MSAPTQPVTSLETELANRPHWSIVLDQATYQPDPTLMRSTIIMLGDVAENGILVWSDCARCGIATSERMGTTYSPDRALFRAIQAAELVADWHNNPDPSIGACQ